MRMWLLAMIASLIPGFGGEQDRPATPAPPTASPSPGHAHCGGDLLTPRTATLLTGYGQGGFAVRTASPRAQAFFDNGMQLGHAFAHSASIAAFHEAVRIDPACAMCLWGEAWASGPTINFPKDPAEIATLAAMTTRAGTLAADGPPRERQLIAALALRYRNGGGKGPGDVAYAKAMDTLARTYPEDKEIAVLAADAWMVPDALGNSTAHIGRAVALLEPVLRRDPDYTPAIHFYIHATEMAGYPARAERYADRLAALAPSASHLVHMPSHTYYWVGRYQDAVDANVRAVAIGKANAARLGLPVPDGVWNLPYHAHNVQFGVGGALMSGDGKDALALSDPLVAKAAVAPKAPIYMQMVAGTGYFAEGRFAEPAAVLALPEPKTIFTRGYWRYARGEAQARLGDAAAVRAEAARIPWTTGAMNANDGSIDATRMLRIARLVLLGRAAMLESRPAEALKAYRKATGYQDTKAFATISDPPAWWYPVRRSMAEALLAGGDAKGALREAATTLRQRPNDPMTLAIRARAEAALGQQRAATADRSAALASWRGERGAFAPALS